MAGKQSIIANFCRIFRRFLTQIEMHFLYTMSKETFQRGCFYNSLFRPSVRSSVRPYVVRRSLNLNKLASTSVIVLFRKIYKIGICYKCFYVIDISYGFLFQISPFHKNFLTCILVMEDCTENVIK